MNKLKLNLFGAQPCQVSGWTKIAQEVERERLLDLLSRTFSMTSRYATARALTLPPIESLKIVRSRSTRSRLPAGHWHDEKHELSLSIEPDGRLPFIMPEVISHEMGHILIETYEVSDLNASSQGRLADPIVDELIAQKFGLLTLTDLGLTAAERAEIVAQGQVLSTQNRYWRELQKWAALYQKLGGELDFLNQKESLPSQHQAWFILTPLQTYLTQISYSIGNACALQGEVMLMPRPTYAMPPLARYISQVWYQARQLPLVPTREEYVAFRMVTTAHFWDLARDLLPVMLHQLPPPRPAKPSL